MTGEVDWWVWSGVWCWLGGLAVVRWLAVVDMWARLSL